MVMLMAGCIMLAMLRIPLADSAEDEEEVFLIDEPGTDTPQLNGQGLDNSGLGTRAASTPPVSSTVAGSALDDMSAPLLQNSRHG